MDCEQFDRLALDVLYDEAEEYERSAALQHLNHCSRCNSFYARLKSAQISAEFSPILPPPELLSQVLTQEQSARAGQGIRQRMGRWMSIVAGYAMRPQVSMGALLLLMIGASLLFLRARPGERDSVHVTEKGIPESEADAVTPVARSPAASSEDRAAPDPAHSGLDPASSGPTRDRDEAARAPSGDEDDAFAAAQQAYKANHFREATELYDKIATAGGPRRDEAALRAAEADLKGRGCAAAVERFDELYVRDPGGSIGSVAAWEAGTCYSQTGHPGRARAYFEHLLKNPLYLERAKRSLVALDLGAHDSPPASLAPDAGASVSTPSANPPTP